MTKMHEILAVEGDLEGEYKRVSEEAIRVFQKGEHFQGKTRTLKMFNEDRSHEEEPAAQHQELTTTVAQKLGYTSKAIINYLDVVLQKEATNQKAVSDLIVDGGTIATGLPATFLLGLETKLKNIRTMYESIPTLSPGIKWSKDESQGPDVWTQEFPEKAMRTEKILKPFVLYEATKEHPAQVKELSDSVNVGVYTSTVVSGMLSPREKSELLGRIDGLIRAVKKARQRANTQEVVKINIGKILMDYIHQSKV